jgi:hypothetical protein
LGLKETINGVGVEDEIRIEESVEGEEKNRVEKGYRGWEGREKDREKGR